MPKTIVLYYPTYLSVLTDYRLKYLQIKNIVLRLFILSAFEYQSVLTVPTYNE